MYKVGNASMAYFHFNFRDAKSQGLQGLVSPSCLLARLLIATSHRTSIPSTIRRGQVVVIWRNT